MALRTPIRGRCTIALTMLSSLGLAAPQVFATDHTVGPGSGIQSTIQVAQNGDRILVQPGVYAEAIDFLGKRLELIGVGGRSVTILDATGLGKPVVHFSKPPLPNPGSRIAGFTIRGGASAFEPYGSHANPHPTGGGIHVSDFTDPVIEDCEIAYNTSAGLGGGVLSTDHYHDAIAAPLILRNCDIHHNTAVQSGGGVAGRVLMEDCHVHHNTSQGEGGGFYAYSAWEPWVAFPTQAIRTVFAFNVSSLSGGGVSGSSLTLLDCRFEDNVSLQGSGGGASLYQTPTSQNAGQVERCQFYRNSALQGGGLHSQALTLGSCVFAANVAPSGDGAYLDLGSQSGSIAVRGCTFLHDGMTITPASTTHTLIGTIVRKNPTPLLGVTNVSYCNIEGGGFPGNGNIDSDPLFIGEATLDLRLQPGSPCVDAGPSDLVGVSSDFENEPRKFGSNVDIGADEFSGDCDADGTFNYQEILAGAPDCNLNWVPDGCEAGDCNGNGINDVCDITSGAALDCNGNGIPDSCDIASGASLDIDRNGVPDECFGILLVPSQYSTIQSAIQAAPQHATILVEDGVYSGLGNVNLDLLGKQISIRSRNGPSRCIIQGGGNSRAIQFDSASENASTAIRGFTFQGFSQTQGAAIRCLQSSAPTIENCIFRDNNASNRGGAVHVATAAHPKFIRCSFLHNTAPIGAAVSTAAASVTLLQCTVAGNFGSGSAIGLSTSGSSSISSCIVWGNAVSAGSLVALDGTSSLNVDHSDIQGGLLSISQGTGSVVYHASNLDLDPQFVDPAIYDVHLRATSPCRDVGIGSTAKDFEGDALLGATDIGADEFATHLYSTGSKTPGGTLTIQLISIPSSNPQLLFMSAAWLNPAVNTPYGPFHLALPLLGGFPVVIPASPTDGVTTLATTIPPGITPIDLFEQAYVGGFVDALTNLDVIEIQ